MRIKQTKHQRHSSNEIVAQTIAVLNKESEPRALFKAWMQLSLRSRIRSEVMSVMNSLAKGCDPVVSSLRVFIESCEAEGVQVLIENRRGTRKFVIEPAGSEYTPASKDCPIKRRPDEPSEQFWLRWNNHRSGIFSSIVYSVFDAAGMDVKQYAQEIVDGAVDGKFEGQVEADFLLGLLRPRDEAEKLAMAKIEVESAPASEPPIAQAILDQIATLTARIAALEQAQGSNVVQFPAPVRPQVTLHRMSDWLAQREAA